MIWGGTRQERRWDLGVSYLARFRSETEFLAGDLVMGGKRQGRVAGHSGVARVVSTLQSDNTEAGGGSKRKEKGYEEEQKRGALLT